MEEKALFTIGVFAGIFDSNGNLLLTRRDEEPYIGKWELPGEAIKRRHAINSEILIKLVLYKAVKTKTGIDILDQVQKMPAMYPAIYNNDIALAVIVGQTKQASTKGETSFVDVETLCMLAYNKELISGKGRTYRMCLRMFASRDCPNEEYRKQASSTLSSIL